MTSKENNLKQIGSAPKAIVGIYLASALVVVASVGFLMFAEQLSIGWGLSIGSTYIAISLVALGFVAVKDKKFPFTNSAQWILLISIFSYLFVVPEVVLRVIDFHFEPSVAYGGLRLKHREYLAPDKDLYWKFPESREGFNSLGFRGDEIKKPKPAKVRRILFLGDSCTDQNFAKLVELILNNSIDTNTIKFECVLLAVPGYSSYQGKVLAKKYVEELQPDLAFAYFGWNDHWLAFGDDDENLAPTSFQVSLNELYHRSRLLQGGRKLLHEFARETEQIVTNIPRVSLTQFESNLKTIDSTFADHGVPLVFITAPTSHYKLGVPDYLIETKLAVSKETVVDLHRSYCQIVRAVADQQSAYLIDLEREFGESSVLEHIFRSDGIHFKDDGLRVMALRIVQYMEENGIIDIMRMNR